MKNMQHTPPVEYLTCQEDFDTKFELAYPGLTHLPWNPPNSIVREVRDMPESYKQVVEPGIFTIIFLNFRRRKKNENKAWV